MPQPIGLRPLLLRVLLAALAYYVAALAGLAFRFPGSSVSILWPPNAVLVIALLYTPVRHWLAIIAACAVAHAAAHTGTGWVFTAYTFTHNVGLAVLAVAFCRRALRWPYRLSDLRSMGLFIGAVVLAAPILTATLWTSLRGLIGLPGATPYTWLLIVFSNVLAFVLFVPIATELYQAALDRQPPSRTHLVEATFLVLAVFTATLFALLGPVGEARPAALLSLSLPVLMWAAVRFGPAGASATLTAMFVVLAMAARDGLGPFTGVPPAGSVLALQAFSVNVAIPILLLAALVRERTTVARAASRAEHALMRSLETSRTSAWSIDVGAGTITIWNSLTRPEFARTVATYEIGAVLSQFCDEDRERVVGLYMSSTPPTLVAEEVRVRSPDGSPCWLLIHGRVQRDEHGDMVALTGTAVDITKRKQVESVLKRSRKRMRALARRVVEARESERQRIGRDIQEDVMQEAAAVGFEIGLARARVTESKSTAALDRARGSLDRLVHRLRTLSHGLRSASLEHVGLAAALDSLCGDAGERHDVRVDYKPGWVPLLSQTRATEIFRAVDELLEFALDREGVCHASVSLSARKSRVRISVMAHGVIAADNQATLLILREYVRLLDGRMRTGEIERGRRYELEMRTSVGSTREVARAI